MTLEQIIVLVIGAAIVISFFKPWKKKPDNTKRLRPIKVRSNENRR